MHSFFKPPRARLPHLLLSCVGALVAILAAAPAGASGASTAKLAAPETASVAPLSLRARAAQAPQGLSPAQIRSVYSLPARGARGQTIAIVSAWDDPHLESDLGAYSRRFGLSPCTVKNHCLRKLNQRGDPSPVPPVDPTGGMFITESSLGVQVAHGICQSCSILLVEAKSPTEPDLGEAIAAAASAGATVIATAYTAPEVSGDSAFLSNFPPPNAPILAAAGDLGYSGSANFPAALSTVLAVGGTQLRYSAGGRFLGERAWSQTTSGCSLYEHPAVWQSAILKAAGCGTQRPVVDLSAAADPGAIVHITGTAQPGGPWYVASGTSLSTPIIAGVIGLAGSAGSREAQMLYQRQQRDPGVFNDVRTGTSAPGCKVTICKAGQGWDGPTGLGTPLGLEAFLPFGAAISRQHPRLSVSAPGGVQVGRNWTFRLRVESGNAFRIRGVINLRRTLQVSGRSRTITFATAAIKLGPLASRTLTLTITPSERALLKRLRSLAVFAQLHASAVTGRSVTVTSKVPLSLK